MPKARAAVAPGKARVLAGSGGWCNLCPMGDRMLDGADQHALQRSHGVARVEIAARDGRAALRDLRQQGSAKVFLPRGGAVDEAVFLNTSGGLTGGDRLHFGFDLAAGLRFTATTQTAERAYASTGAAARVEVDLRVGAGARLDWLPQETILFETAHLLRHTRVQLDPGATCLLAETVVLGRLAMGETPAAARLFDRREVTCAGRPVWNDALQLTPAALAARAGAALLGPARCLAVIALIGPGAADAAPALRPDLAAEGCDTALSAWNGRLVLRLAAHDIWPLRQQMARLLARLRGRPLPRVWQMNGDIA